ncbi:hypothetical protein ACWEQG_15245 [Microbispora sp. NPDC004025]
MSVVLALLGVLASIAGIVQTIVVIIERAERRRREPASAGSAGHPTRVTEEPAPQRPLATSPADPPWNPEIVGAAWRSALAYLLGFAGGLIFRRNRRPDVRFHAMQSILIDLVAVIYFPISLIAAGIYASIRYPGPNAHIPSADVVMWTWAATSVFGPPALHLLLAVLTLIGRRPRIPLLWKVAATVTAA